MARTKAYNELEVLDKAMNLFWRNGFESTSMQMLEKEMGINKFSIYSSFGSKNGLFIQSIKNYKIKLSKVLSVLKNSNNGLVGLKQYFYDFIEFSKENEAFRGCLVTNTSNELNAGADPKIVAQLQAFIGEVKSTFENNLKQESQLDPATVAQYTDYLVISMFGIASASRVFDQQQLSSQIEMTFKNL